MDQAGATSIIKRSPVPPTLTLLRTNASKMIRLLTVTEITKKWPREACAYEYRSPRDFSGKTDRCRLGEASL